MELLKSEIMLNEWGFMDTKNNWKIQVADVLIRSKRMKLFENWVTRPWCLQSNLKCKDRQDLIWLWPICLIISISYFFGQNSLPKDQGWDKIHDEFVTVSIGYDRKHLLTLSKSFWNNICKDISKRKIIFQVSFNRSGFSHSYQVSKISKIYFN